MEAGQDQWLDDSELAISEVVTNATLHAHTDIEVLIEVFSEAVCVEVRDFDDTLPVQRDYGDEATTGRGIALLAALTEHCGVRSLGAAGKVIWFCVGSGGHRAPDDDGFTTSGAEGEAPEGPVSGDMRDVVLAAMPATLWLSAREHHDAMIRELGYYLASNPGPDLDIAAADKARSTISATLASVLEQATAAGATRPVLPEGVPGRLPWVPEHLDLSLTVPADGSWMFAAMQDVLDFAEILAVDGQMLLRPGLPEIVAVRDWACEQVIAQLAGIPPTPWPGTAQQRFETEVRASTATGGQWDPAAVTGAAGPAVAADDANRIVAVSQPLAELLGWQRDDLVGRRVVTIVPPRLREAHVAGFSRHLSTGEAHLLGIPLDLPVLTADGAEIVCRVVIELASADAGRAVYVARMEPIEGP